MGLALLELHVILLLVLGQTLHPLHFLLTLDRQLVHWRLIIVLTVTGHLAIALIRNGVIPSTSRSLAAAAPSSLPRRLKEVERAIVTLLLQSFTSALVDDTGVHRLHLFALINAEEVDEA